VGIISKLLVNTTIITITQHQEEEQRQVKSVRQDREESFTRQILSIVLVLFQRRRREGNGKLLMELAQEGARRMRKMRQLRNVRS